MCYFSIPYLTCCSILYYFFPSAACGRSSFSGKPAAVANSQRGWHSKVALALQQRRNWLASLHCSGYNSRARSTIAVLTPGRLQRTAVVPCLVQNACSSNPSLGDILVVAPSLGGAQWWFFQGLESHGNGIQRPLSSGISINEDCRGSYW